MNLTAPERTKLATLLLELGGAVEEVLLSGLTTASETTQKTLQMSLQEATRLRLLRFGATLRHTQDELGRYLRKEAEFAPRRLAFFLNRTWLLARAMIRALRQNNDAEFEQLNWTPPVQPLEQLHVVALGVSKKVTPAIVLFEFRLRAVADSGPVKKGQHLLWACLFNQKPGANIPPEGWLALPQKQKFKTEIFTGDRVVDLASINLAQVDNAPWRITLTDTSTATPGDACTDWTPYAEWNPEPLIERLAAAQPGPFDLEVDLQDEAVLTDWELGAPEEHKDETKWIYPIVWHGLTLQGEVPSTLEGKALKTALDELRKRRKRHRPPLFGLLHFDRCRPIFQPLSLLERDGPEFLTLSKEKVDPKALLQVLKF
jgi:hypothetical protein